MSITDKFIEAGGIKFQYREAAAIGKTIAARSSSSCMARAGNRRESARFPAMLGERHRVLIPSRPGFDETPIGDCKTQPRRGRGGGEIHRRRSGRTESASRRAIGRRRDRVLAGGSSSRAGRKPRALGAGGVCRASWAARWSRGAAARRTSPRWQSASMARILLGICAERCGKAADRQERAGQYGRFAAPDGQQRSQGAARRDQSADAAARRRRPIR